MNEYVKIIETTNEHKVNKLFAEGWELIGTSKHSEVEGEEYLRYSVGLPAKAQINRLIAIIREYEKQGFKDILFEKYADQQGDNIKDYETVGVIVSKSPLASFMSNYEEVVNNEKVSYFKKEDNDRFNPEYVDDEF